MGFGGFGQSSKRAAQRQNPMLAQQQDMDVPRAPQQRAIRLPQMQAGNSVMDMDGNMQSFADLRRPHEAPSGWIEDPMDDMAPEPITGYTMRPGGGFRRHMGDPLEQQPRFGGMPLPEARPIVPQQPENQGMGAMDIIGGAGAQGRLGNMFDSNLMQYAAGRNMQFQDAERARKRSGWNSIVRDIGGPLMGMLGLAPETAQEQLTGRIDADRKLMQGVDPTTFLKDADLMLKLAQGSDPASYKNQKMLAEIEKQKALAGAATTKANATSLRAADYGEFLRGKTAQGWNQQEINGFKAQVYADVQNGKLDIAEANQIMKEAESTSRIGLNEAKTRHTDADTERVKALTQKVGADMNNNYQKLMQGNQKIDILRQKYELAAQKATDANTKWQYEQAAKNLANQQRFNMQQYKQDAMMKMRDLQVNSKGEEVYPGFEKYLQQLQDADLVAPQQDYMQGLPALPSFGAPAQQAPRQAQPQRRLQQRLQEPAKAPAATPGKQAAPPVKSQVNSQKKPKLSEAQVRELLKQRGYKF